MLYKAANEGGYLNPVKVQDILGITKEQANTPDVEPDVVPTPPAPSGAAEGTPRGQWSTIKITTKKCNRKFKWLTEFEILFSTGNKEKREKYHPKLSGELSTMILL